MQHTYNCIMFTCKAEPQPTLHPSISVWRVIVNPPRPQFVRHKLERLESSSVRKRAIANVCCDNVFSRVFFSFSINSFKVAGKLAKFHFRAVPTGALNLLAQAVSLAFFQKSFRNLLGCRFMNCTSAVM